METSGKTEESETAHWPRELNVDVREIRIYGANLFLSNIF